jgi:DNA repair exonuclease SbcCD nuclease subunit
MNSISHIIHIADIHIRHGDIERSRYNEYTNVLNNFINSIKTLESVINNTALTVIAGDLFHNKGKIDTPAAKLYFSWMNELLKLTDVVVICGNHDFKQEDHDHPDMIDVFTYPFNNENDNDAHKLYYLKDTGNYTIHNISFGVVSIKDILRKYNTSGSIDSLEFPPFPQPSSDSNLINIALFHGSHYPSDWFNGYKIAILGDNHKQTIFHNTQYDYTLGYSGSLIQQDFGESSFNHGYLLWNLENFTATPFDIYNPYTMLTIRKINSKFSIVNTIDKKTIYTPLDESIYGQFFPQEPRIRYIGQIDEEIELTTYLTDMGISPKDIYINTPIIETIIDESDDNSNVSNIINQISDLNNPDKWIEYLNSIGLNDNTITSWLENPDLMKINSNSIDLSNDIQKRIIERISKLDNLFEEYKQSLSKINNSNKYNIILQNMSWDYVLCYGANNYFDFTKLATFLLHV